MSQNHTEPWLNYAALTTILFAVCATLSSFKEGGYSTESLSCQTQISDQWAHYQSKSIKFYLYELQVENLQAELDEIKDSAKAEKIQKRIADYKAKTTQYINDKEQIKKEADKLEVSRKDYSLRDRAFGVAVIFLQISILLSSISVLMKKKFVWYIGMGVGLFGLYYFTNGFFLF